MKENITKSILVTVTTIIMSRYSVVVIPIALVLGAFIVDYLTGMCAAKFRGQKIRSDIGKDGILKKLGMGAIIIACIMVDILIIYGCALASITMGYYFIVTTLVSVLIFLNESISILENVKDMNVYIPAFLLPLIKNIRSKVESKAEDSVNEFTSNLTDKLKKDGE